MPSSALDENQALQVLLFLAPSCAARVQATSRTGSLGGAAKSEVLWAEHAARVFGTSAEEPPPHRSLLGQAHGGGGAESAWSAAAFAVWHAAAREVGIEVKDGLPSFAPLPARWVAAWARLRGWLGEHAPEVAQTLRPGVKAVDVAMFSEALSPIHGCMRPSHMILGMWQIFDGQDTPLEDPHLAHELGMRQLLPDDSWSLGVLGGYTAYNHEVSVMLLPLVAAAKLTRFLHLHITSFAQEHPTKVAFACSHNLGKIFLVDMADGDVFVKTCRSSPILERAVPASSSGGFVEDDEVRLCGIQARPELNGTRGVLMTFNGARWQVMTQDSSKPILLKEDNLEKVSRDANEWSVEPCSGLVRWIEEYVRRLEKGVYTKRPLKPDQAPTAHGICLFPSTGPELSLCVTNGVEVTASCVYMPEHPQGWSYSISLRLVGTAAERGFESCQLTTREWEIQEDGCPAQYVRGEGVIGFFPILVDGGWVLNTESDPHQQYQRQHGTIEGPFRYQSCSGRSASMRGHFGGTLTFVPGSRRKQTGQAFKARLEPFRLCVPKYLY